MMAVVTLAKLLRVKTRLRNVMLRVSQDAVQKNSVPDGQLQPNVKYLLNQYTKLTSAIVTVRTLIYEANRTVVRHLYQLEELKNRVKWLRAMNCTHGPAVPPVVADQTLVLYNASVLDSERLRMITMLEDEIDNLTDHISDFNTATKVELPDDVLQLLAAEK
jgi:hypothetical protein